MKHFRYSTYYSPTPSHLLSPSLSLTEKQGPERKRIKKEPSSTRKAGLPFGMGMPGIRAGYPLSERQQVALLMQMTAEESVNSPGACLTLIPHPLATHSDLCVLSVCVGGECVSWRGCFRVCVYILCIVKVIVYFYIYA